MGKVRLDWFKLDCVTDDKISLIEAQFGLAGFAAVVKLWQKIYGGEGYYCKWDDDVRLLFARSLGMTLKEIDTLISACVKRGLFDDGMLKKYGILTSHGIQQRYYECADRRKKEVIQPEYLLLDSEEKENSVEKNEEFFEKNEEKFEEPTDFFEKTPTDKKRKEKNRSDENRQTALPDFSQVTLSEEELAELVRLSDRLTVESYIRNLSNWQEENKRVSKKPYVTLRSQIEEDKARTRIPEPKPDAGQPPKSGSPSYDLEGWLSEGALMDLDTLLNPPPEEAAEPSPQADEQSGQT